MLLEIACFNIQSCIIAQKAGADRIEFCSDYNSGGITPTHENIIEARKQIQIPLHIIIRPRKGNFVYSKNEIKKMKEDILFCKSNKINGVVLGILNDQNEIDELACKELIEYTKPMHFTFHRAIDSCKDLNKSVEKLIELGFNSVLTSGGSSDAKSGIEKLKNLQNNFGNKIIIMPGGGIRPENIKLIKQETNCIIFHSSAINLNSKTIDVDIITKLLQAINS